MGPLATRVDIDRLLRAVSASDDFINAKPYGSCGKELKTNPLSHMSPYVIKATLKSSGKGMTIGIIDSKDPSTKQSTSGARLYVAGPPHDCSPTLRKAAALLLETDFDLGCLSKLGMGPGCAASLRGSGA